MDYHTEDEILTMKMKRRAVFQSGLKNSLRESKYLRKLRGLLRDIRCSMINDTKIAIEAHCYATSGFDPKSV